MTEKIVNDIVAWANEFDLKIKIDHLKESMINDCYELDSALVFALESSGFVAFLEQGSTPEDYLPGLIECFLSLIDDKDIKLESVKTDDDWMSAKAVIVDGNKKTEIVITDVNQSDWVPNDLFSELENYTKKNCNKTFYSFHSEDPFLVLYLSEEAINKYKSIRDQLPIPEIS